MRANYVLMTVMTVGLLLATWHFKGIARTGEGLKAGALMLWRIWPLLLLALAVAGLLGVLVPRDMVSRYLGASAPLRGILIGWVIGAVLPGAPYVSLPLAAALLAHGAGIGPVLTMVLSASLLSVTRIPYEVAFVGWQFAAVRVAACALLPPAGGLIAHLLNAVLRVYPAA
jgi:uncharacterized membrane protein YraQ (UPF0718 family)